MLFYIPLDKWLKSLPFHGSIHGFESRTVYHIKTYLTDRIPARSRVLFGGADTLRKSTLSEVENIEYVLIWFNGCSGTLECLGWL